MDIFFQDARKGVLFSDFPPVLQLQLKRFEYDFTRDVMVKVGLSVIIVPVCYFRVFGSPIVCYSFKVNIVILQTLSYMSHIIFLIFVHFGSEGNLDCYDYDNCLAVQFAMDSV